MPEGERTAEDELLEKFRPVGRFSGSEILLRPADALHFVDDCEKLGLVILGMDFWVERGDAVVEVGSTEWSSITSRPDAARRSQDEARAVLSGRLPGDVEFVSFVVEEPAGRPKA